MKKKLGLIVGDGDLPLRLIDHLQSQNTEFCIVDLIGRSIDCSRSTLLHVQIGEVGKILQFLRTHHVTDIILIGGIKRPSFKSIKVDAVGAKWLAKLGLATFGGDDQLLRRVTELLQAEGFALQRADTYLPQILASTKLNTSLQPASSEKLDIEKGVQILKSLSPYDVGQAIVLENGIVLGIEAAEGTKELIARCAPLKQQASSGFLIKMAKTNQIHTADLPTIGLDTVKDLIHFGYRGLAVEAEKVQVIDADQCRKEAEDKGFIITVF